MNIVEQFNKVSDDYDSQRKKLIPCYDDFYSIAIENLEFSTNQPKILDLGAGTGLFSKKVLEKYPQARIKLVDISDKMLEIASSRFIGNQNIEIKNEDYRFENYSDSYDAVISSLSIHHLEDEEKYKLYLNIYKWLNPNGIFINAEQILADNSYLRDLYSKKWKAKIESTDLNKKDIENAYERVKLDKRTPLNTQLDWLKEVGFENVDCLYKYYDFVVIWANK